jgi:hypothetical protein
MPIVHVGTCQAGTDACRQAPGGRVRGAGGAFDISKLSANAKIAEGDAAKRSDPSVTAVSLRAEVPRRVSVPE